jgi:hypothetical protein
MSITGTLLFCGSDISSGISTGSVVVLPETPSSLIESVVVEDVIEVSLSE